MSDSSLPSLEATLVRNFPGLTVLDHDLELSERFRADLVAMERSGRLVFVLLVEAGGDEAVLAAFDALAFARHNQGVLALHFEEPRLRADQPPRVLLVAQAFAAGVAERLRPLVSGSVELYEVRHLKSARGENVFLAAVGGGAPATGPGSEKAFLASLSPDLVGIARHCLGKMARLDDELSTHAAAGRVAWSFRGRDLARMELAGDRLQGAVAPEYEARVLRSTAQVDFFVEEVLARYVLCLGAHASGDEGAAPRPPAPAAVAAPAWSRADPDDDEEEEERPRGFAGLGAGTILSEEELRAFQD